MFNSKVLKKHNDAATKEERIIAATATATENKKVFQIIIDNKVIFETSNLKLAFKMLKKLKEGKIVERGGRD